MAARILRLRLALLVAPLRSRARRALVTICAVLVLAAAVALGGMQLLTLQDAGADAAAVVTVLTGSALTLGFVAAPMLTGASDPLDPRAFRPFGIGSGSLAATLAAAGLVSVPMLALVALAVCTAVMWTQRGVAWPLTAMSAMLGIATCALSARVFGAVAGMVLAPRRSRELTGLFVVGVLVVVVPVGVFFASVRWGGHAPETLVGAIRVLADTPIGAAWALSWRPGAASLAIAWATVLALAAIWWAIVHRTLHTAERPAVARGSGGLGWFAVTPGTPGGAVAARSLAYWLTDRRYLANLLVVPVAAIVTMVPLLVVGVPFRWVVLIPVPLMALFLGWLPHNDLAYDSTAVWLHISTGVRGIADRAGRLVPILLIGLAVLAITIPVAVGLHGRWLMALPMIGVCASLFLGGLGLSSIASVAAPSPVSRPGDSPFRQPERTSAAGAFAQGGVLLGSLVVASPALWWTWLTIADAQDASYALWGGVTVGVVVLAVGVVVGAVVFERRGMSLLELAEAS